MAAEFMCKLGIIHTPTHKSLGKLYVRAKEYFSTVKGTDLWHNIGRTQVLR